MFGRYVPSPRIPLPPAPTPLGLGLVLALAFGTPASALTPPDAVRLPDARRLDALVRAHPSNAAEVVRNLLAESGEPDETFGYAYVKLADRDEGIVLPVDETLIRMNPWQSPPSWYVAFRYGDRRYGSDQPPAPRFDLEMAAPHGADIAVGIYENARAFGRGEDGRPGLTVKGLLREDGGRFEIVEMNRNKVLLLDRFGATFETPSSRGFVVYRRGRRDATGLVTDETPIQPRPDVPIPSLGDVLAKYAQEDPRLADVDIPGTPAEDFALFWCSGEEWIGRGEKHLIVAHGAELEMEYGWSPPNRIADLEFRRQRPDGFYDVWEHMFACGIQEELAVGYYPYAGGIPYQAVGYPGMRVAWLNRGCIGAAGWFKILELKRNAAGEFVSLSIEYAQHCEGWGPALKGIMVYRKGSGASR